MEHSWCFRPLRQLLEMDSPQESSRNFFYLDVIMLASASHKIVDGDHLNFCSKLPGPRTPRQEINHTLKTCPSWRYEYCNTQWRSPTPSPTPSIPPLLTRRYYSRHEDGVHRNHSRNLRSVANTGAELSHVFAFSSLGSTVPHFQRSLFLFQLVWIWKEDLSRAFQCHWVDFGSKYVDSNYICGRTY